MANVYSNVSEIVGHTPILKADNYSKISNLKSNIYLKLESFNPAGSAKDRVAKYMIDDAIKSGKLKKGATIIEPTSGNTGIGLCAIAASMGYKCIIIMPDTMSKERIMLMKAYGAEVILTDGKKGMAGSIEKANELNGQIANSIIAGQFVNPANPKAHYETTGPEIWNDLDGNIDMFVAGIGTGGTITGVGRYLKEKNSSIKIVGVEPYDSPLITKGKSGPHGLQGIGANFIPEILDVKILDEVITITTEEAYNEARVLAKSEGILVGISSGAALAAAKKLALKEENKNIVVLLPDTGDRYLSTSLFE